MTDKKVAWVLGSGFSKSLGGPLLYDLLSYRGEAYVASKFPGIDRSIYQLFWRHLKGLPANGNNPIYWDHAEEFLDFLNTATPEGGPDRYDILRKLVYREMPKTPDEDVFESLREDAVRCLAAECLFTTHTSVRSEAWGPYRKWARNIGPNDTIITFNYDMVLEKLGEHDPKLRFGAETVVSPTRPDTTEIDEARTVKILKLHGSVGWFTYERAFLTANTDSGAAEKLREGMIPFAIGPGPDKLLHQEGMLKPLWAKAVDALKNSDVIVFMGYRFPPSDSQAREQLLKAIKAIPPKYVRLHTVLGPHVEHEHSVRLMRLLAHTLEDAGRSFPVRRHHEWESPMKYEGAHHEAHVIQHALYVEDFLTVVHPKLLYGEPWDPGTVR